MLEDVDLFKGFWVAEEREDGVVRLRITDFASGERHDIEMPEAVYSTGAGMNAEYDTRRFRFVYTSYVTPRSVYDYDVAKRTRKLLKQQPVLGGYDAGAVRLGDALRAARRTARGSRCRSSGRSPCARRGRSRCSSTATARTATRWT